MADKPCKSCIHEKTCITANPDMVKKTYQCEHYLPTADVEEVKHGKWSLHPDGSGTCSNCGRTQKAVWDFDNAQEYCGRCGAKMDGGKNEKRS